MFNPFVSQPFIESVDALYERTEQRDLLRTFFRDRADAVIFGPEGSGKSVLLRCFFNLEYRRKMAQKHTLIHLGEFPKNLDGEATYGYFADAIRTSVEFLEFCGMTDQMAAILRSLDAIRFDTKQSRFAQYLNKVQGFGFRVVFILDNFENFTSSPDVKPEHHDLLCGMLNDDKLQLIVASNFDFNETSLPVGTRNSKLLTRLSPHSIHMMPLSVDACQALLDHIAEEEDDDFRFTPQQVQVLHSLSGGIPLLLHMAAKHAFAALEDGEASFADAVRERTLPEALPILKHWCKVTPEEQLNLLATLQENVELPEDDKIVASALVERGLLRKAFFIGRNGRQITADGYTYNSGLFRDFCSHRDWLDAVLKENPLRKEPEHKESFSVSDLDPIPHFPLPPFPVPQGNNTIYISNMTYHQGNSYSHTEDHSVTNQNFHVADNGFTRLFEILDLTGEALGSKLQEILGNTPKALPGVIDAELAAEEAADRITAMFIPEEVEEDALEECQEEQRTLEARFHAVRSRIDPEGLLSDALLDSLSTKCRLYLQIAFVVDDALSALNDFLLDDLSAQMVMYGKVLEQQLKDNLYQLFRKDDVLKDIDLSTNSPDSWSRNNFGFMKLHRTCIGNYMNMMRGQSQRLEALCLANKVSFENQPLNSLWWRTLGDDVDAARKLRNGGDHAGTETSRNDLSSMRQLLFGTGNILHRCSAGLMLTHAIWPPQPKAVPTAAPGTADDKESYVGKIVDMTNIQVTARNGLRGTIAGTSYGVSISRKHLEDRNCRPQDQLGKTIRVKITQWDNNPSSQRFNAELA